MNRFPALTRGAVMLAVSWCAACCPGGEIIYVKILVDEEEATTDQVWMKRLKERLEKASFVIAQHAGIRFVVRKYGKWATDNSIQDFSLSLREFERRVPVKNCRLAIGFSSQYRFRSGRQHLGGTRGPMRSHILIRENAPSTHEPERLEVLVHELGHYMGAAHSASSTSVMRPVVGDGQARRAAFKIDFDPSNAAILRLVGREIRQRHVENYFALSPTTLAALKPHYQELRRQSPNDKTSIRYLAVIQRLLSGQRPEATSTETIRRIPGPGEIPRPGSLPIKPGDDR